MRTRSAPAARILILTLVLAGLHPAAAGSPRVPAALPEPNPLVADMIAQVTTATVVTYTGGLSGEWPVLVGGAPYLITTRHTDSGTPIDKATQYAYEHLAALGLSPSYQPWTDGSHSNRNVSGVLTGTVHPDEIVLIGAHIDSYTPQVNPAPGADDDASGTAGVLVAADILSRYEFERTVRFVLWTGEEQWMLGSYAYAAAAQSAGDNIVAVLSLDMIAYDGLDGPTLHLRTRRPDQTGYALDLVTASTFTNVVNTYGLSDQLTPVFTPDGDVAGDHASFWDHGYPAVMAIEDDDHDFNPYYHTTDERLYHLNLPYFTAFVKASVGTIAHLAGPRGEAGALDGTVTAAGTGTPLAGARLQAWRGAWPLTTFTGPDGHYSLGVVSGTYTVTAEAYGYLPAAAAGLAVPANITVTQDFALVAAPQYVVSGTVSDALTGRPLHAQLAVQGEPLGPPPPYDTILTDPATGFYSTTLAGGTVYTFTVDALDEGYVPQARGLGALAGGRTEDFALAADPLTCVAPGYVRLRGMYQSFDGAAIPPDWIVVDQQGSGQIWRFDDPGGRGNLTGGTGAFAIVDSDAYGYSGVQNTELRSPALDLTGFPTATLEFKTDYYHLTADVADVDVSVNGAAGPWTNVWRRTVSTRGPRTEHVDLTAVAAGHANVMLRFHYYQASYAWWWQVDDVLVGPTQCVPGDKVYLPIVR